ncbi:MAG: FAD-dependent oxidoreductase [Chloroflexia bacterium]
MTSDHISENGDPSPRRAVVLGGTPEGIQAALQLAGEFEVTLIEPSPFLGNPHPPSRSAWMAEVPAALEVLHHKRISVLTQTVVEDISRREDGRFRLQVQQLPRYVDPERCTGCGECAAVCPVEISTEDGRHRAIYRLPPERSVPNVLVIAKRGVPPCTAACPGGIPVQGYVALVAQGRFEEARDLIARAIPFPGICGRVCHHPCEEHCSRTELDEAVAIRALKRFVADRTAGRELRWEKAEAGSGLPPVAVIGAGPAGLTVAWELARAGLRITVFEALPVAGGMMAVGIPAYRLPREVLHREIAAIQALGVEIRLNTPLGPTLTLDDLFAQGYGAVFLGLGAHRGRRLGIPGEDLAGVVQAVELLREVNLAQEAGRRDLCAHLREARGWELGRRAAVIGGGNSAVDAARTLLRLGVEEVHLLYRRSRQEMPAGPEEVAAAEEEGVLLETLVAPRRIIGREGRVVALECQRMALGKPDESGRTRPIPIPGSEFTLELEWVVPAVGQEADRGPLAELCDADGRLWVDEATGRTRRPGVYAGGDIVRPASVIEAIGAGKRAARAILHDLRGEEVPPEEERPVARWAPGELEERERQARQRPAVLSPRRRKRDFAEVERSFTPEQAVAEAGRCLACGPCSECLRCEAVCEPRAIHHAARSRRFTLEAEVVFSALTPSPLPLSPFPKWERGRGEKGGGGEGLGIFLCRCGEGIAGVLPLEEWQARAMALPGVVRVEQVPFACLPEGRAFLRQAALGLAGAVLAACSCCNLAQICSACTTQRVRCRAGLGLWEEEEGDSRPAWEFVNLREHCIGLYGAEAGAEVAWEMVVAAAARLRAGPPDPLPARVDERRCRACGTCQTLCRAGAVHLEEDALGRMRAIVQEERCRACGTCAAHCPTGAVTAGRISDRQIEATLEAFLPAGSEGRVLVFTCNWGGHGGAEAAGMEGRTLPPEVRLLRLPCLGRVSPSLLLHALERGAAGVLLQGCPEGACHYDFGRETAVQALSQARALAELLGMGAERLALGGSAPGDGEAFAQAVRSFVEQVRKRG